MTIRKPYKKYDIDTKLVKQIETTIYADLKEDKLKLNNLEDCQLIEGKFKAFSEILNMIKLYKIVKEG